ncbi:Dihydrofolate reductase-like domain protein [Cordyceps fumosorosea ARSEF 2679]|uniref:2,5-diamino-6-ribosylamino-4(3H)-pyrimidinone 5'-phosphate reductase n=1 Tax=Cordyceps fumosorosea (strain ARSEF 2679) TaxID=1081104 RepID=A0A167UDB4_CORFA|nr:Dihydrofolate reductase-like domain protein [Cordyceps fumosorosea ARSEF 2679]OAA61472.1 Dihydrofolate reductase-like domain protein [Cordyceps fumosorosea ARSEF 2679]
MAEKLTFSAEHAALLEPHLPPTVAPEEEGSGIWVTLTYAQSLDSCLSLAPGVRTRLSGPESKAMTHHLRSRHDAILVGVSTLLADDPALNCRIAGAEQQQPRPVVVDPHLRWTPRLTDKVLEAQRRGAGLAPFVVTAAESGVSAEAAHVLEQHGGKYIQLESAAAGPDGRLQLDWRTVFARLAEEQGIASVMVEGGGQVINSLLAPACAGLVSSVIVTIAPTWLGQGGVVVSPARVHDRAGSPAPAARLCDVVWHPFGDDIVLCGRLERPQ